MFQNAHPCRLKKIHVVHTVSFINQVMCLIKPLIHSNLLNLLNFSSEGPEAVVDKDLLPEDYGGPQPPVKQLHEEQRKNMEENYRDWIIESESFKVDEKKRIKKPSKGMFASFTSSFKSLDIDWLLYYFIGMGTWYFKAWQNVFLVFTHYRIQIVIFMCMVLCTHG